MKRDTWKGMWISLVHNVRLLTLLSLQQLVQTSRGGAQMLVSEHL